MCLAVPGEILEVEGNHAKADFGGAEREIQLDLLEDVAEGDYVLVHVGQTFKPFFLKKQRKCCNSGGM